MLTFAQLFCLFTECFQCLKFALMIFFINLSGHSWISRISTRAGNAQRSWSRQIVATQKVHRDSWWLGERRKWFATVKGRRFTSRSVLEDTPSISQGEHQHNAGNREVWQGRTFHHNTRCRASAAAQDESHLAAGERHRADVEHIKEPRWHHTEERRHIGASRTVIEHRSKHQRRALDYRWDNSTVWQVAQQIRSTRDHWQDFALLCFHLLSRLRLLYRSKATLLITQDIPKQTSLKLKFMLQRRTTRWMNFIVNYCARSALWEKRVNNKYFYSRPNPPMLVKNLCILMTHKFRFLWLF